MGYMMLQAMETGKVHLLPGLFAERAEVNRAYLMELENQGLLQNFYLEAGIIMPGLTLWKWAFCAMWMATTPM